MHSANAALLPDAAHLCHVLVRHLVAEQKS